MYLLNQNIRFKYILIALIYILIMGSVHANADSKKILSETSSISLQRQQELTYIVQQDCGSCHGMTLKGGLGPSLLPQRLSVLPKDYLIETITHGRKGTPMPPWEPILTSSEIHWIVDQLQAGQLAQKSR